MEIIAYVLGTMGFIFGMSASMKVANLEKKLKRSGVIADEK